MIGFLIRHFKTLAFFGGFIADSLFLPTITSEYYVWIGPVDIGVVLFFLILEQTFKRNLVKRNKQLKKEFKEKKSEEIKIEDDLKTKWHKRIEKLTSLSTYGVSFFLGTLLSHTLVYYLRSADIFQMWPIFLIVAIAVLGNEFFYKAIPGIVLFYIGLTFYLIFNVPILLNTVDTHTFFISILVSVIVTSVLTFLFQRIYLSKKDMILLIVFSIFFPFLLLRLYYLNFMPAVPLELGDSGFYSNVIKLNTNTGVTYSKETTGFSEKKELFIFKDDSYDLSQLDNDSLYFFSSIISPADVSAEITHVWEKYDPKTKLWVKQAEVGYSISGGRDSGYRGYSEVSNLSEGRWRVRVLADGRLVGLKKVTID